MNDLTVKSPATITDIDTTGDCPKREHGKKVSLLKDSKPDTFEKSEPDKPEKEKVTLSGVVSAGVTATGVGAVTYKATQAAADGMIDNIAKAASGIIDDIGVKKLCTDLAQSGIKGPKFLQRITPTFKKLAKCSKSIGKTAKGAVKYCAAGVAALCTGVAAYRKADKTKEADLSASFSAVAKNPEAA